MRKLSFKLLALTLLAVGATVFLPSDSVQAQQVGSNFNASRIIDDSLFYNGNELTPTQIQQFLNARVPVCDTNGTKLHWSGQTRAQWAAANSRPLPPYICLKDFVASSTPAKSDSGLCAPIPAYTNRSAAQIIDDVARACNISQKVLLVTLEKEQSLLSDDWPWPVQYEKAMGYYCPDDPTRPGWCAPEYAGFFNQVYNAARQFQRYRQSPTSFNHAVGRTSYVAFQANAPSCGGTNLTIQTAATAGLYNYTPYQPNQAALNNLYGTGDSCSAYGNRNFWRMFSDWFGSTKDSIPTTYDIRLVGPISFSPVKPSAGESILASYTVKNFSNISVTYQNSVLQCRINSTNNCDPSWSGSDTILPGQEKSFNFTIPATLGGDYAIIPYVLRGGIWYRIGAEPSVQNTVNISVPDIRLISKINSSNESPAVGKSSNIRFTIKNFGTRSTYLDTTVLQCRLNNSINCDSSYGGSINVLPNQQFTFDYTINFSTEGIFRLVPYFRHNNTWYTYRATSPIENSIEYDVADLRLVGPITTNPVSPIPGQSMTISYTVRNFGDRPAILQNSVLQCRLNTTTNCDTGYTNSLTINPGQERTFTESIPSVQQGTYVFNPYLRQNGLWRLYTKSPFANNSLTLAVQ
jgi:hypothetical protein